MHMRDLWAQAREVLGYWHQSFRFSPKVSLKNKTPAQTT
jgi:hypothetical protein